MKKKVLLSILTMAFIALPACEELLTSEESGEKASKEFCECMKENSLSDCEKKLNSAYSSYTNDDKFIKAFNNANNCGATISKKN